MADRQYTVYPSADGYTVRHQGVRAHTLHSSAVQRLCVGVHGLSNNKTLIASRTIDVDHEPPPPLATCWSLLPSTLETENCFLYVYLSIVKSDEPMINIYCQHRRAAVARLFT
jgi:hypothetical protein